MANKLDTEKKLFLGAKAVREATTFGAIRKAVADLDKGEGVSYADLEKHMLENFKPAKSESYGPSFIKSYVRDAVNKFGYLSHEDQGHKYEVLAPVEKKADEPKPKKFTKRDNEKLDTLAFVRDRGEVGDVSEIDSTKITSVSIMEETKKKQKTVDKLVEDLEKDGFVRTETVDDSTYVFLTATGLSYVNEHRGDAAAEAETVQPEGTAAETADVVEADDAEA